jgi:Fis family transcriptional regulator, factor for inversion stimulation protein
MNAKLPTQQIPLPNGHWQCLNTDEHGDNPVQQAVRAALDALWETLEGDQPSNLYDLVIAQIERPLLETAMLRCDQNQSRAAECLGINRSTLRKKLKQHQLLEQNGH